jgi:hypothetical protein
MNKQFLSGGGRPGADMFNAPTWMPTGTVWSSLVQKAPEREPRSFHLNGGALSGVLGLGTDRSLGRGFASIVRNALAQPLGDFVLAQLACRQAFEKYDQFGLGCFKLKAIIDDEGFANDERRALVAIDKWMIARESKGIARCKRCRVGFPISRKVPRACERTIEQTLVPNARAAAVDRKLLIVNGKDE